MARPRKSPAHATCLVCGTLFFVPAAKPRRTCSDACYRVTRRWAREGKKFPGKGGKQRTSPTERSCVICGRFFPLTVGQAIEGTRTCSLDCRRAYFSHLRGGRVELVCEACSRSYPARPFDAKRGRRFCGNTCRNAWFSQHFKAESSPQWRGGRIPYYGPNWKDQRRAALERDASTCQDCGRNKERNGQKVSVHHIQSFRAFGLARYLEANALENLLCLCRSCHQRRERRVQRHQ